MDGSNYSIALKSILILSFITGSFQVGQNLCNFDTDDCGFVGRQNALVWTKAGNVRLPETDGSGSKSGGILWANVTDKGGNQETSASITSPKGFIKDIHRCISFSVFVTNELTSLQVILRGSDGTDFGGSRDVVYFLDEIEEKFNLGWTDIQVPLDRISIYENEVAEFFFYHLDEPIIDDIFAIDNVQAMVKCDGE